MSNDVEKIIELYEESKKIEKAKNAFKKIIYIFEDYARHLEEDHEIPINSRYFGDLLERSDDYRAKLLCALEEYKCFLRDL